MKIDARGLKCPLPVLKLEKAVAGLEVGSNLTLLATDPIARIDVLHFCNQNGHAATLLERDGATEFSIVVGDAGGKTEAV